MSYRKEDKPYLAIVRVEDNRIAKIQEFELEAEAEAHVAIYGGFVYYHSGTYPINWIWIDENNVVTYVDPVSLSEYKEEAISRLEDEAGDRIAALFNTQYATKTLRDRQLNDLMQYNNLREKELTEPVIITAQEQNRIANLRTKMMYINTIRDIQSVAETAINQATDTDGINDVSVIWPGD